MAWNNRINAPNWSGYGIDTNKTISTININTLNANNISTGILYAKTVSTNLLNARSISSLNASIGFINNAVLNTGVIGLGIGPTYLTANDGILYVNGDAVAFPSTLSTIADWSYFPAVADVNFNFSTIYNVKAISTNSISTGTLNTGLLNATTINATTAKLSSVIGSTITISDNFTGSRLFANLISTNIFSSESSRIITLNSSNINVSTINSSNANISNVLGSTITLTNNFIGDKLFTNLISTNVLNVNKTTTNSISTNIISTGVINAGAFNASSINAGTFNTSNIFSYNITNSNTLTNLGDAQFNTLQASGTMTANYALNVNNSLYLNNYSVIYGRTTNNFSPLGEQTQFHNSIENILDITTNSLTVIGCGTGNEYEPPYRNYSIVNIGETEFAPAVVTLYGFNPTGDTAALTVNGETNIQLGSFNSYYTANFYPFNFEANALNAYGTAYFYGAATVDGLFTAAGAATVEGFATMLGGANVVGEFSATGFAALSGGALATGLFTVQQGDINFNNNGTGYVGTFYNHGGTVLNRGLTLTGDGVAHNNFSVGGNETVNGNLTVNGLIFGTVVSGSETISTLNVSTIRAFNISSITTTTKELFVSTINGLPFGGGGSVGAILNVSSIVNLSTIAGNGTNPIKFLNPVIFNSNINVSTIASHRIELSGKIEGDPVDDGGLYFYRPTDISKIDPVGVLGYIPISDALTFGGRNVNIASSDSLEIGAFDNINIRAALGEITMNNLVGQGQLNVSSLSTFVMNTTELFTQSIGNNFSFIDDTPIRINNTLDLIGNNIINGGLISTNTLFTSSINANVISNINSISLNLFLPPLWSNSVTYSNSQKVEYAGSNWTSVVPVGKYNKNNEPGNITTWQTAQNYELGNIRLDPDVVNLYYCRSNVNGSIVKPNIDSNNWEFYASNAPSESIWTPSVINTTGLIGNANSLFTVGGAKFFSRAGEYLSIQNSFNEDPAETDASITSAGAMVFSAQKGLVFQSETLGAAIFSQSGVVSLLSLNGEVSLQSVNSNVVIDGGAGTLVTSEAGDVNIFTGAGDIVINSSNGVNITGGLINVNNTTSFNNYGLTNVKTINDKYLFNYGFFYKTTTQTLDVSSTARRVTIQTSGLANGMTLDTTTNIGRITFTNTGIYSVVWNAYLLHGTGGSTNSYIWIRKNGTDVPGTAKIENNDSQLNETNLTSSALLSITANDYIEFFWAATGTNVPLKAIAASGILPATPSFSCTISIVG